MWTRWSNLRWALLVVGLAVGSLTAVTLGGPKEARPLSLDDDGAAADAGPRMAAATTRPAGAQENQAFYYSRGKKVYLNQTGLAVYKLKEGVNPQAELPIRPATLSPDDPLRKMSSSLRKNGLVIVSADGGPEAMDLRATAANPPNNVEWAMPVVEPAGGAGGAGATRPVSQPAKLIMTPRISARFKGVADADVENYVRPYGLKVARKLEYTPGGYVLELAEGRATYDRVLKAANSLYEKGTREQKVVYSHPDAIVEKREQAAPAGAAPAANGGPPPAAPPDDPEFKQQWHLHNTGQGNGKAGADVKALEAWAISAGSPDIAIGIIDDSVEKGHPDLKENFKGRPVLQRRHGRARRRSLTARR
jgi:hypothetical protein